MANFTRRNAWNNDGTFENSDLRWYAEGVRVMQSLPLDNPNSWWFFAAIHGQDIQGGSPFTAWGFIPGPPEVPTTPLPAQDVREQYWDQCQHQSWYFPPWHRGYLLALEAQIRAAIVSLGGPADWALPYWNYFASEEQRKIPPAFIEQAMPDQTPNPLFVSARYGLNLDGNIFVSNDVNANCQNIAIYTGINDIGYGGPDTGFRHGGGGSGTLESNPHNLVHTEVGGAELAQRLLFDVGLEFVGNLNNGLLPAELHDAFQDNGHSLSPEVAVVIVQPGTLWRIVDVEQGQDFFIFNNASLNTLQVFDINLGLMSNPNTAALDPIFYLHHANIDRMWAAWNANGNSNPTDANWLSGPAAIGQREFVMPLPDGSSPPFTPADVNSLMDLDYAYDDLTTGLTSEVANELAERLKGLGVAPAAAETARGGNMEGEEDAELLGANDGTLQITGSGARTTVRLDSEVRGGVSESIRAASETSLPDRVYLRLENVRGIIDAFKLKVSVNQQNVGTVALFGLQQASLMDGQHGGGGLTFTFDISNIIDNLFLNNALDVDSLDVEIEPNHTFADIAQLTVGRVTVYRQGIQ